MDSNTIRDHRFDFLHSYIIFISFLYMAMPNFINTQSRLLDT
jgi:hypothetical protein